MTSFQNFPAKLSRHNLLIPFLKREVAANAVKDEAISENELNSARSSFYQERGIKDERSLSNLMLSNGWSEEDLLWQICLPLRIHKHCQQHYRHKAEAHFLKRKNQLDTVIYSLLRVKDNFLAQELYWRIEAGEANFGDLASAYAEGPERNTKGIVGPVPMAQAHPVLAEALRITKPGRLMDPMQIGEWWIVARLENYTPASFDEAMASRLSHELFEQWIEAEAASMITTLNGSAKSRHT